MTHPFHKKRVVGGSQRIGQVDSDAIIWIDGSASYLKDYLRANGVPDAFDGWRKTSPIVPQFRGRTQQYPS